MAELCPPQLHSPPGICRTASPYRIVGAKGRTGPKERTVGTPGPPVSESVRVCVQAFTWIQMLQCSRLDVIAILHSAIVDHWLLYLLDIVASNVEEASSALALIFCGARTLVSSSFALMSAERHSLSWTTVRHLYLWGRARKYLKARPRATLGPPPLVATTNTREDAFRRQADL